MRLERLRRQVGGLIDRRGQRSRGGLPGLGFPSGGGPGGLPGGFPDLGDGGLPIPSGSGSPRTSGRGLGLGGLIVIVIIVLIVLVLPQLLGGGGGLLPDAGIDGFPQAGGGGSQIEVDPSDPIGDFVDAVGDDVQITWQEVFAGAGRSYERTQIVLFRDLTQTACGPGTAQTGPFYCPLDRRVYLDFSFFEELERRFGTSGDFAEAYVIAHEIGHHVQTLLGIAEQVQQASRQDPSNANALSIRQELQADCLAGVWGHSANARGVLEPGDIEEGLDAAAAVGDDRIQASVSGRISPESWTHGSAEQRVRWLRRGFDAGTPDACDTFSIPGDQL